ncbi:MAG: PIG-L family deacetylase [Clostridia bacterium]
MKKNVFKICISILVILIIVFTVEKIYIKKEMSDEKAIYHRKFKENVVFYPQHQDDEVLWGASAIINAIAQCGFENVYIVLVSDGSGVNVFKNKEYKNLTRKEKEELRNNEFKDALKKLGVKKDNIIILADIDSHEGTHFELMEDIILKFEKELRSVTHIAHHYEYDNHIMHRKNGKVLKNLTDKNEVKDVMYFVKPKYVKNIPLNKRVIYEVNNTKDYEKVKSACYEYKIVDTKKEKFGIGYISAHSYFDELLNDPKYKSVLSIY